jgi:putative transcriptional regulator
MTDAHPTDTDEQLDDSEMDWDAFDALTDEDVQAAVALDPDAAPLTDAQLAAGQRAPDVRAIRALLGLSQSEFAARFGFSTRTVQEWEQRRSVPNRGYRLYLNAIADPRRFLNLLDPQQAPHADEQQHTRDVARSTGG